MVRLNGCVPKDDIEAYKWYNLAEIGGEKTAKQLRDDIAKKMTATQILQALHESDSFVPHNKISSEQTNKSDQSHGLPF